MSALRADTSPDARISQPPAFTEFGGLIADSCRLLVLVEHVPPVNSTAAVTTCDNPVALTHDDLAAGTELPKRVVAVCECADVQGRPRHRRMAGGSWPLGPARRGICPADFLAVLTRPGQAAPVGDPHPLVMRLRPDEPRDGNAVRLSRRTDPRGA